jgi:hypothetical protein
MSIYDDFQIIAKELLTEFHQDRLQYIEMIPATGGTPDNPGTPTTKTYDIPDGVARGVEYKYIDGSQVVGTEGQITCAVGEFVPKIGNFVSVNGDTHKIVKATAIPPTGTPVVYVMVYER